MQRVYCIILVITLYQYRLKIDVGRRLTNLWHACPKPRAERFPWHVWLTALPIFKFLLPDQRLCIVKNTYIYIHISDFIQTLYKLPLLLNKTASRIFLHKSREVRSVDWIFITGGAGLGLTGRVRGIEKAFYDLLFKAWIISSHSYLDINFRFCIISIFLSLLESLSLVSYVKAKYLQLNASWPRGLSSTTILKEAANIEVGLCRSESVDSASNATLIASFSRLPSYCSVTFLPLTSVNQHPANRTHNSQLHTRPATWKTTAQNTTLSNHSIILLSSWWWA